MEVSEAKRLKALEDENEKLKKLLADAELLQRRRPRVHRGQSNFRRFDDREQ